MAVLATIELPNEKATGALGAALARMVAAGDVIRLEGDLGAGKSTLARGFVRELAGAGEVPSPTFTLVETYETPDFIIWHFDLYRLESADDVWELGLEEALDGGVVLIEWPDRAEGLLPEGALTVTIEAVGDARRARIVGEASWQARLKATGIE